MGWDLLNTFLEHDIFLSIVLFLLLWSIINVKGETITISSSTDIKDKTIEDVRDQSNVIIVNNGNLKINNSTVNKEGNGTDNVIDSNKNSAILRSYTIQSYKSTSYKYCYKAF